MPAVVTLAGATGVTIGVLAEFGTIEGNVITGVDGKTVLIVLRVSVTVVDRRGVIVDVDEEIQSVVTEADEDATTEIDGDIDGMDGSANCVDPCISAGAEIQATGTVETMVSAQDEATDIPEPPATGTLETTEDIQDEVTNADEQPTGPGPVAFFIATATLPPDLQLELFLHPTRLLFNSLRGS